MFSRLLWKETRQTWPVWAFLAFAGLAFQGLVWCLTPSQGPGHNPGYVSVAGIITSIYLFLIAASAFAGERENGTLGMLDALPVGRLRLWAAKAGFALATTTALGVLLWLTALAFGSDPSEWARAAGVAMVWGLTALGWGLLWSAIMANALHAAVLAMACLGGTLAAAVNLQEGPTLSATPTLLVTALATAAASVVVFLRTGPPRWEPRRGRPATQTVVETGPEPVAVADRRLSQVWSYSVVRLAWETWRQVRSESMIMIGVAVGGIAFNYLTEWNRDAGPGPVTTLTMVALTIMAGVAAFNGENRGKTHRFLLQHGARPGVVWAVKVLIWWATAAVLLVLVQSPNFWRLGGVPINGTMAGPGIVAKIITGVLGGLTIPFAVGALCGMVFRRGIMAGTIAVVIVIGLAAILGPLAVSGLLPIEQLGYIAIGFLAVSWAWSGDWLRFAPGAAKWARLALWCGLVTGVLVPGYTAERAWGVPTITAIQANALFQPGRFLGTPPEDENAAPLYREAEKLVRAAGIDLAMTPTDPGVAAWLEKVEPALAIIRRAAQLTNCVYEDPRKSTIFRMPPEPPYYQLTTPLAVSARARLARGDLEGSWGEMETLLRMARQYSTVRSWTYFQIEPLAVGLAMQWAADPRQTASTLERALSEFKALPPGSRPADRLRVDRIAFHNTMELPQSVLIDDYLGGYGFRRKVGTIEAIQTRILTTPWEVARARRVYDLLAASWIQMLGDSPFAEVPRSQDSRAVANWRASRLESFRSLVLEQQNGPMLTYSPDDLNGLLQSTPTARWAEPGMEITRSTGIETGRRALGLILKLRLFQARHGGVLPHTLDMLKQWQGDENPDFDRDPYSRARFGYIPSSGQPLLPLEDVLHEGHIQVNDRSLLKPSDGCWLLYSIGPDLVDDRADHNLNNIQQGDLIYPLKDGVKPPEAGSP